MPLDQHTIDAIWEEIFPEFDRNPDTDGRPIEEIIKELRESLKQLEIPINTLVNTEAESPISPPENTSPPPRYSDMVRHFMTEFADRPFEQWQNEYDKFKKLPENASDEDQEIHNLLHTLFQAKKMCAFGEKLSFTKEALEKFLSIPFSFPELTENQSNLLRDTAKIFRETYEKAGTIFDTLKDIKEMLHPENNSLEYWQQKQESFNKKDSTLYKTLSQICEAKCILMGDVPNNVTLALRRFKKFKENIVPKFPILNTHFQELYNQVISHLETEKQKIEITNKKEEEEKTKKMITLIKNPNVENLYDLFCINPLTNINPIIINTIEKHLMENPALQEELIRKICNYAQKEMIFINKKNKSQYITYLQLIASIPYQNIANLLQEKMIYMIQNPEELLFNEKNELAIRDISADTINHILNKLRLFSKISPSDKDDYNKIVPKLQSTAILKTLGVALTTSEEDTRKLLEKSLQIPPFSSLKFIETILGISFLDLPPKNKNPLKLKLRGLKKEYHPDHHKDDPKATIIFQAVNNIETILKDLGYAA